MRWSYIFGGVLILLVGSYIDNLRGPLLPVLTHTLRIPYSQTSWFFVMGSVVAVATTFLLMPILHRFGERRVCFAICLVALLASLSGLLVSNFPTLLLMALLMGVAIASLGAMCNILTIQGTTPTYRARVLCGLHVMYGLGSLVAPVSVRFWLGQGYSWTVVLLAAIPAVAVMFLYLLRFGPDSVPQSLDTPAFLRPNRAQKMILFTFGTYVCGEVLTSMWLTTYLVEQMKLSVESAAPYVSGFFLAMAASRALCFISVTPRHEAWILRGCMAAAFMAFCLGRMGYLWGFSLVGLLGPYFPVLLGRVTREFPDQARSLTLWILTSLQVSLAISHWAMGCFTDLVGISVTFWIPLFFLGLALCTLMIYLRLEARNVSRV